MRKKKSTKESVKCIIFLSSSENDNWDKAKRKEDKQLRYINTYAKKHSLVPMEMDDIEDFLDRRTNNTVKYVIAKELRWRVRDMLDQLNMSERIVYPGLDGLSKWIARHYFVK